MSVPALDPEVDLVNGALLGTDRRGVPAPAGEDPAAWLLEAAARRRAGALVQGATTRLPPPGPAGPAAPAPGPPPPPVPARAVLDEILLSTGSEPVNLWLREALAAGHGLAPEHWTPVLDRARRASDLDRPRLRVALGPRGLWFARRNPAWAAVVRTLEAAGAPDDLLSAAQTAQALDALAAGTEPVGSARALGRLVGARLPLDAYAALERLAGAPADQAARAGLTAALEVLQGRWLLAQAFDPAAPHPVPERRP